MLLTVKDADYLKDARPHQLFFWKIPYFLPAVSASGSGHSAWRSVPAEDTVSAPICILGNRGTHRADIFNIDIFTHHIIWRHMHICSCSHLLR